MTDDKIKFPPKSNDPKYKDFIQTSDFTLATTLYCLGFDIRGLDKGNKKRVTFYYERTSDLESVIEDYFNNKIKVNPLDFDRAGREIRAQIHTVI